MIIAHKIALDPNESQQTYFARACGTARFASNWALAGVKLPVGVKMREALRFASALRLPRNRPP